MLVILSICKFIANLKSVEFKLIFFSPRPACKARGRGHGATFLQVHEPPLKIGEVSPSVIHWNNQSKADNSKLLCDWLRLAARFRRMSK